MGIWEVFVEEADELVSSSRALNIEYTGYKDTSTENPVNILGFRANTERSKISKKDGSQITLLGVAREDLGCYQLPFFGSVIITKENRKSTA